MMAIQVNLMALSEYLGSHMMGMSKLGSADD